MVNNGTCPEWNTRNGKGKESTATRPWRQSQRFAEAQSEEIANPTGQSEATPQLKSKLAEIDCLTTSSITSTLSAKKFLSTKASAATAQRPRSDSGPPTSHQRLCADRSLPLCESPAASSAHPQPSFRAAAAERICPGLPGGERPQPETEPAN
jgi:hypothetical protein